MSEFAEFVRSHGLRPRYAVVPDGKVHRCPTENHPRSRNGAYHLALDGAFGWVQDWSTMTEPVVWRPGEESEPPDFDPARMRRARAEARAKRRYAIHEVREFYRECKPLRGGHPYLMSHGLGMAGCSGLKVDAEGWLVIPAQRRNRIMTVQRIAPDGTKRFWKDAPAKAATYIIRRQNSSVMVLCEGFATGLALYAAMRPLASVLVAFNTGNLTEEDVHVRIPPGMVVVAADNDHETAERIGKNPGVEAAQAAAEALGCGVAIPEGLTGTDWADLRQERFQDRLAKRYDEYTPDSALLRAVDAEIRMAVMRHAKMRTTEQKAG